MTPDIFLIANLIAALLSLWALLEVLGVGPEDWP